MSRAEEKTPVEPLEPVDVFHMAVLAVVVALLEVVVATACFISGSVPGGATALLSAAVCIGAGRVLWRAGERSIGVRFD